MPLVRLADRRYTTDEQRRSVTFVPASAARFPRPGVVFRPLAGEALSFRLVALRQRGLAPPAVRSFLEVLRDVGRGV